MRRIAVLLCIALLIFWTAGMTAQAQPHGEQAGKPPVLFLGNDSLPPINFMQGGKPAGIVVDLARAIAERMPSRVDIRLTHWAEAQQLVLEGRADALLQMNPSPERERLYDFSDPLLTSEFAIFVPAGRTGIGRKDDLRGLRVGVEEKGLPVLLLRQDPAIDVRTVPDIVQGFRMLAAGAVDAVVADRWVGGYVLAENRIEGVRAVAEPIERSHSAIAVRKGNTNLLLQINAALAAIRSDGTYDRIVESWRPKEVVFKTREELHRQAWLTAAIAAALVAALAIVAALVWEVRRRRRAESALREQIERYSLVVAGAHGAIWDWDVPSKRVFYSPQWKEMRGYAEDEVGEDETEWSSGIHPDDAPRVFAAVQAHFEGKSPVFAEEYRIRCKDGTWKWIFDRGMARYDAAGRVVRMAGSETDITERKQAEEALRKAKDELEERVKERTYELYAESFYARSLIEASLDPLVTISVDGKITDVNHATEEVTGVPREQLIGSDFSNYFTEPQKARAGYEQVFRHGFVRDYPLELKRRDGHVTPVLYNASVYRDDSGRNMGVFAAARDITERRQAESVLRRLSSELAMAEERERKRIAGVLHDDIAQTLATVRMRLDLLQGIASDQSDRQTLKEAKTLLVQSLKETRALMNDLGNPVLFDLGLKAACEALANQMMERHPVRIRCDIGEAFKELNPDMKTILFQSVKELLNNVVKHSRAHHARLMIDRENKHLRVKVTDDGVGFDPQALGAPTVEGGFGLYNIRERLMAIGGSLGIESIPGTGTAVTAILPEKLD